MILQGHLPRRPHHHPEYVKRTPRLHRERFETDAAFAAELYRSGLFALSQLPATNVLVSVMVQSVFLWLQWTSTIAFADAFRDS